MKYTVPDYYQEFHCIAGECPATCCAGWQIVIDERSLNRYKNLKGAFGNRLNNSIDWEQGTFLQYDGRCAFLNEDNLCDIYTEAGSHMFCRTCRNYPRHIEEFENEREISLSLSCPAAAKLILQKKEPVFFLSAEKECEDEEIEDFDFFLYSALQDCRTAMIKILQDRKEPISFRMAKVLALAHDVQNRLDARQIFEMESLLERYQREGANEKLKRKMAPYQAKKIETAEYDALLVLLDQLEVLDPSWSKQIKADRAALGQVIMDCRQKEICSAYETELEQLMVYFIFTYFCGAVYDGEAFGKVKMAVVCTLLLHILWRVEEVKTESTEDRVSKVEEAKVKSTEDRVSKVEEAKVESTADRVSKVEEAKVESTADRVSKVQKVKVESTADRACQEQESGTEQTWSARQRTAWRFSRELEHSDPNLDKMEEMMKTQEAASFERLLEMCLQI